MRPGGSSALPHYDFAEEFAYRVNLGTQVDPDFEVLVRLSLSNPFWSSRQNPSSLLPSGAKQGV